MTREEARQFGLNLLHGIVERNKVSDPCYANNVKQAIDALSQPPLPSNLDEAARKAALMPELVGVDEEHLDEYPYSPIAEQKFKEGAEWLAGQGCTVEIDEGYFINNPHHDRRKGKFHKYYSSVFGHSKKITVPRGDTIVVQIRKIEEESK